MIIMMIIRYRNLLRPFQGFKIHRKVVKHRLARSSKCSYFPTILKSKLQRGRFWSWTTTQAGFEFGSNRILFLKKHTPMFCCIFLYPTKAMDITFQKGENVITQVPGQG